MPRTTILLVECPACYHLHPQNYWGPCEDQQHRYKNAEEYAARHPEANHPVEVLEFA